MRHLPPAPVLAPALGLLAALFATPPVRAERAALHDIPYYMGHPTVRSATLSLCRSDHSYDHDPDCHNAETAEDRLYFERARGAVPRAASTPPSRSRVRTPGELLRSEQYWTENRLARIGVLAACRNPVTGYTAAECEAARRADAADPTRRGQQ